MRLVTTAKRIGLAGGEPRPAVSLALRVAVSRVLTVAAVCLVVSSAAGPFNAVSAGEDRPAIVATELRIEHGYLVADITARGLFPERITGTVESGLPAVVQFMFHVMGQGGGSVEAGVRSYSLNHDVWEDVYSVSGPDSTIILPSLESMRSLIEHMQSIALVPVGRMVPERTYYVQVSVAVSPLQGAEREEMEGWVRRNVESSGSSWHEQVLNINDLIESFFSGNDDSELRSKWFRSDDFRPETLAAAGRENE